MMNALLMKALRAKSSEAHQGAPLPRPPADNIITRNTESSPCTLTPLMHPYFNRAGWQDLKDKFRECGTVVYANVTRGDDGRWQSRTAWCLLGNFVLEGWP